MITFIVCSLLVRLWLNLTYLAIVRIKISLEFSKCCSTNEMSCWNRNFFFVSRKLPSPNYKCVHCFKSYSILTFYFRQIWSFNESIYFDFVSRHYLHIDNTASYEQLNTMKYGVKNSNCVIRTQLWIVNFLYFAVCEAKLLLQNQFI